VTVGVGKKDWKARRARRKEKNMPPTIRKALSVLSMFAFVGVSLVVGLGAAYAQEIRTDGCGMIPSMEAL